MIIYGIICLVARRYTMALIYHYTIADIYNACLFSCILKRFQDTF